MRKTTMMSSTPFLTRKSVGNGIMGTVINTNSTVYTLIFACTVIRKIMPSLSARNYLPVTTILGMVIPRMIDSPLPMAVKTMNLV